MIIKIKKRDLRIVSMALFLIILIPYIFAQTQTPVTGAFGVWIIIDNANPVNITVANTTLSINPNSGDDKVILIVFNVSDPDGVEQINGTNGGAVSVNLTLGAPDIAQFRTQSSCTNTTDDANGVVTFSCTVNLRYYDNASAAWVINITVTDSGSGSATNATNTFTYNSLAAFSITAKGVSEAANLNFTSLNIGDLNKPAKAPILLNNTGNNDFDQINITGADLFSGANTLVIGSFAVNTTNNTVGNGLPLTTGTQTIPVLSGDAILIHGPGVSGDTVPYPGAPDSQTKGNLSLYFFIDVPAGTTSGTYNNTWNMTLIDLG